MIPFFDLRFVRVYLIPGAVFQSVVVAGGYGTGRELVEYFVQYGFLGGLMGIAIAMTGAMIVLALTFEFARMTGEYEYRGFFKRLIGPFWVGYELIYGLMLLLVLSIIGAAAGDIIAMQLNLPTWLGLFLMLTLVGLLQFYGREIIARLLTFWSFYLYAVFIWLFIYIISEHGHEILNQAEKLEVLPGWGLAGFKYFFYNVALAPVILFATRSIETRKEAYVSGAIAGGMAIFPGLLFHVIFFSAYPEIIEQSLPVYFLISQMGLTVFLVFYMVMLFGTFVETGAGMVQGLNDRIDSSRTETGKRPLSRYHRALTAILMIVLSAALAQLGIVDLISEGYGTIAWGFLAIYVLPLLTIGVIKIMSEPRIRTN